MTKFRHYRAIAILSMFASILLFSYNNCGGTQPSESGLLNGESGIQSFSSEDSTAVSLNILQDPIFIQENDIGFNAGGFCETSNFERHEIHWTLKDINGGVVIPSRTIRNACREKRFNISVLFQNNYNYDLQHILEVELIVKDDNGMEQGQAKVSINVSTL